MVYRNKVQDSKKFNMNHHDKEQMKKEKREKGVFPTES